MRFGESTPEVCVYPVRDPEFKENLENLRDCYGFYRTFIEASYVHNRHEIQPAVENEQGCPNGLCRCWNWCKAGFVPKLNL
jgi:hypothetical protein